MICNIVDVLSAALTPLIAALAIYIAYQQWRTNHLRYMHESYDRRFEIYKVVQIHLSYIFQYAKVNEDELHVLLDALQKSRFLIGIEMHEYINTIYKHSLKVSMYKSQLEGVPVGGKRNELVEKEHKELAWLIDQLPILADKFDPYLSLR